MSTSGVQKAALLLADLPRELAAQVLARLPIGQAELVSAEILRLPITSSQQHTVFEEFTREKSNSKLHKPSHASAVEAQENRLLEFLFPLQPWELRNLVSDEHPQVVALLLNQLPAEQATAYLKALPESERQNLIQRMTKLQPVHSEIQREIAGCFKNRLRNSARTGLANNTNSQDRVVQASEPLGLAKQANLHEEFGYQEQQLAREHRPTMHSTLHRRDQPHSGPAKPVQARKNISTPIGKLAHNLRMKLGW